MATTTATDTLSPWQRASKIARDYPVVPLILLLIALVAFLEFRQPGIFNERWIGNTIRFAIPLAMLAACQTLTMLTGGIDLSAAVTATVSAFVVATMTPQIGPGAAIAVALVPAVTMGAINGLGIGICKVHPLIMTLATSLIGTGCLQVYQRFVINTGSVVPPVLEWLGTGRTFGIVPNAIILFIPFALFILWGLKRTGFGRLLYALGANEKATRLSGVRSWQVLLALYTLSGLIAGITGLVYVGIIRAPSLSLANGLMLPSVAAAVIGGTSIFGGRGFYSGTIVGALILTVLNTLLTLLQIPEGARLMIYGGIILAVTAAYVRLTDQR